MDGYYNIIYLIGGIPTPVKNDGASNSWDDDIPNMMGKKKSWSKPPTSYSIVYQRLSMGTPQSQFLPESLRPCSSLPSLLPRFPSTEHLGPLSRRRPSSCLPPGGKTLRLPPQRRKRGAGKLSRKWSESGASTKNTSCFCQQ